MILLGDDAVEIGPWDTIRVSPETVRSFEAGSEGLELLAIGPSGSGDAQLQQG